MRYSALATRRGSKSQAPECEVGSLAGRKPARSIASLLTCIFIACFPTAGSTQADFVYDNASGLAVTPPEGYSAARIAPDATFAARISVKKPDDRDTGCQVAFEPLPQNAGYTQDQLNSVMASRPWLDLARASLLVLYHEIDIAPFAHAGVGGVVMVADLKPRAGVPSRSQEVRTLFFIRETPKGRTTTVCVGEKANFDARRIEFETVARGATPPR
jgi:hypothetical protein